MFFKNKLGFNAGMITTRKPESGLTQHTVVADHNVFNGKKSVAHVHGIVGIGKRENNGKRFFLFVYLGGKSTRFFPKSVNGPFVVRGKIAFVKNFHKVSIFKLNLSLAIIPLGEKRGVMIQYRI